MKLKDEFMESAMKRGMLLRSVQEEGDESKIASYNACKSLSNGPGAARRILDADFSFTYNTAGEDFLRMARERLEMLANGGMDSMNNHAAELDLMGSAYTSPILDEEELNDESKFDKLRIPLKICVLGVDGLENKALNEFSKLTCRMHLMDEFGKPKAPPRKPFSKIDRKRYPHCATLPAIGVTNSSNDGTCSFRARYDDTKLVKLELDIYQTFAYPRWKGNLLVEFSIPNPEYLKQSKEEEEKEESKENMLESEIVVAKFDIPYTAFADGKTVKFCTPKKLPDGKDADWNEPVPLNSQDSDARLYVHVLTLTHIARIFLIRAPTQVLENVERI